MTLSAANEPQSLRAVAVVFRAGVARAVTLSR